MSANEERPDPTAGSEALKAQLLQLEAFVARANAEGDPIPPTALEMIERLRELVRALDGFTASLESE